uniref:UDP-glucuronosyltransferase n=1 Tax=Clastoptera arizonana TaxID=38151 RepID=A0A1B6DQ16_9HEMI
MLLCVIFAIMHSVIGAKILVFSPMPVYSHQQPIAALTKGLLARGHNVTLLTTNPIKIKSENFTEYDASSMYSLRSNPRLNQFYQEKVLGVFHLAVITSDMLIEFYKLATITAFESSVIQNFVKIIYNETYDVVISETMVAGPFLALGHITNAPTVSISTLSFWNLHGYPMGNPTIPTYMPNVLLPYSDHMNFIERIKNLYVSNYLIFLYNWKLLPLHEFYLRKYFGAEIPSVREMESRQSLQLICTSEILSYPVPKVPGIVHVGALHIETPKPLEADLKMWMENAKDGVIYFSLGSNFKATSLPANAQETFINAFARFPNTRFIWKWESDKYFPGQPPNVKFIKWVPQQDLLAHPNIRGFITQGGIQSLQEAVMYSVPIIGMPMYIDQGFNVHKIVSVGAGVLLDLTEVTAETVYNSLNKIINEKSYKENMMKLSNLVKDEPQKPMEKAIWWIEYVIRNKGTPFRNSSLDLYWYQYLMLDILCFFVCILVLIGLVIYKIIKTIKDLVFTKVKRRKLKAK